MRDLTLLSSKEGCKCVVFLVVHISRTAVVGSLKLLICNVTIQLPGETQGR